MSNPHDRHFHIEATSQTDAFSLDLEDVMYLNMIFQSILMKFKNNSNWNNYMCWTIDGLNFVSEDNRRMARIYIIASLNKGMTKPAHSMESYMVNAKHNPLNSRDARIQFLEQNLTRFDQILKEHQYPF